MNETWIVRSLFLWQGGRREIGNLLMRNSTAQLKQCRSVATPVSVQRIPACGLLTHEQENELAGLIASGDPNARNRLVQANLGLVVKIAHDFLGRGLDLDDLVGEGNLGLIRAAKEFDPQFGTRFSTYAAYWIKQSIRHALINTTSTIRLPAHMIGLLTKWRRAERALRREGGEPPAFDDVASVLGLTAKQKMLVSIARQSLHLTAESTVAGDLFSCALSDTQSSHQPPLTSVETRDEWRLVSERMQCLDERERLILVLRYGLDGEEPQTLKEISRRTRDRS